MIQASDGNFYGTTYAGGSDNSGTVFKLSLSYSTLTVSVAGSGTVTSTDGCINCPGTCSHSYVDNTPVTLNATPASGWAFSSWGGACSGSNPSCNLTMTQNTSVSASFYQLPVTLTVSVVGSGTVTSTDGYINCPGTCTHTYDPNSPVTLNAAASRAGTSPDGPAPAPASAPATDHDRQPGGHRCLHRAGPWTDIQRRHALPSGRHAKDRQSHQGGTSQSFIVPQLGGCNIPIHRRSLFAERHRGATGTLGYLTIWPTGEAQPTISTMNSLDGRIKANAAIVPAGTNDAVSVYASNTTDLVLDIDGYFSPSGGSDLQFYPLTPCRVLDTRKRQRRAGRPVSEERRGARLPGAVEQLQHSRYRRGLLVQLHRGAVPAASRWAI